jgi:hypothetical protein
LRGRYFRLLRLKSATLVFVASVSDATVKLGETADFARLAKKWVWTTGLKAVETEFENQRRDRSEGRFVNVSRIESGR